VRRDNDLIRTLLFKYEADDEWLLLTVGDTSGASSDERRENYHMQLLIDQGFLTFVGDSAFRITAQGHDYLDAVRDEGIWQQAKNVVRETGGSATLEVMKALAVGLMKRKISEHTGLEI